jgi:hypothetical protein
MSQDRTVREAARLRGDSMNTPVAKSKTAPVSHHDREVLVYATALHDELENLLTSLLQQNSYTFRGVGSSL